MINKNIKLKNSLIDKEFIKLIIIYVAGVFSIYFFGRQVSLFIFLFLIYLFWKSSNNYFWFALIFYFIFTPGEILQNIPMHSHSLPGIPLNSFSREIEFLEIFVVFALIKALKYNYKADHFFSGSLLLLGGYAVFVLLPLSIYIGTDSYKLLKACRLLFLYTLFFSIPSLIRSEREYGNFFKLLFPLTFFIIFSQLVKITTGYDLGSLLSGPAHDISIYDLGSSAFVRPLYSGDFLLTIFIVTIFYLSEKKCVFNNNYLFVILISCIFSAILSATRGLLISLLLMYLLQIIFIQKKNDKKKIFLNIWWIFLIMVLMINIPNVKKHLNKSISRIDTIKSIVEGDLTANNTLIRLSKRSPRVLGQFSKRPLLGYGFSNIRSEYADIHVGNQTILLEGGVFGFILIIFFLLKVNFKVYKLNKKLSKYNRYKNSLLAFNIGFAGLFFVHSTSCQIFGFLPPTKPGALSLIMLLCFSSFIYHKIDILEKTIKFKN